MIAKEQTHYEQKRDRCISAGICFYCESRVPISGKLHCAECGINRSLSKKAKAIQRKSLGLCRLCDTPARPGFATCQLCGDKRSTTKRIRSKAYADAGLCVSCGSVAINITTSTSARYCKEHYLKDRARDMLGSTKAYLEIEKLLETQQYKCYYCDIDIKLGINAELDHKNSRAKFPGEAKNILNVAWACKPCNRAKGDLTADEFIMLCKQVVIKWQP